MKKSKIAIHIAGYILIILSLVFIVYTIQKIDLDFLFHHLDPSFLLLLVPLAMLYGGVFVLLGFNYSLIVSSLHKEEKTNFQIIPHYLKSNIGKYLPTNLFHFAGRHLLLHNIGYENNKILISNIMEFIILISISLTLLFTGLVSGLIRIPAAVMELAAQNRVLFIIAGTILCAGSVIVCIKFKAKRILSIINSLLSGFSFPVILLLILSYSIFFIFTGTSLYFILIHFSGRGFSFVHLFYIIFTFAICWQIGFISPGVPGGIGVREALLLLFISTPYGETSAVYAGIALRLTTISGDIIAFLYAILINKILKNHKVAE